MTQDPKLLKYAANMRREATPFEIILWRNLSNSQLGHKFRRQHVIGNLIVDFFCPSKALAIEVDGETHDQAQNDRRDTVLGRAGVTVLHFTNSEIRTNLEGVLSHIVAQLALRPDRWPHPNPSPEGEGL